MEVFTDSSHLVRFRRAFGHSSVLRSLCLKFKLYLSIPPVLPDLFNMLSCWHCSYALYDTKLKPAGKKVPVSFLNRVRLFDTLLKYKTKDIQHAGNISGLYLKQTNKPKTNPPD